ncbi:unnamed protein product, partial [Ascophyllum nodosum]
SRRRSHRVDAIRQILSLARDAQSSVKHALAKRFAKLQKPGAALCSLPIVLAALEDLVAPQRLSDKPAARSSETGSIASFAACTTGRSTANSATDSSGSAAFISLRLLEGEELLQSSRIPSSIVEVGDGVTRKWSFQDLASNTEAHVAKIIGGGCFAQVACTTLANGAKLAIKEMTNWHPTLQSHTEEYIAREIKMLEDCSVHPY